MTIKRAVVPGSFLFALLAVLLWGVSPAAADVYGVAAVTQGDSLTVGSRRVRLYGIDAPPVTMKCSIEGTIWDCGRQSRDQLAHLVEGQRLRCAEEGRDRWGRVLATCYLPSSQDLGAEMVREGLAIAFTEVSDRYAGVEERARRDHRGIWAGTFPPPWQWTDNPKSLK